MIIKRLLLLCVLFVGLYSYGQNPTNYLLRQTRERVISFMVDSMLRIPRYNGTPSGVRTSETSAIDGAIAMDTTNHRMYIFSGNAWVRLAKFSEVGGSAAGNYGNLQINRNGAFDTPGSDSLSFNTKTLFVKDTVDADVVKLGKSTGTKGIAKFYDASNKTASISTPDAFTANYTLTLPVDDGNSGELLQTNGSGGLSWYDISPLTKQQDTIALASFGAGGGNAGDTTSFTTSTIYGSFYNDGSDTLVITSFRAVLQGTSPSITPYVYYNDSLNVTAGATKLVNSPSALTNTATGVSSTPDNSKIPPGVWVWVSTPTVTTKPTYFTLTLIGYKKRK